MTRYVRVMLAVALATLGMSIPAGAQITTGTLAGSVRDSQGAGVPGATVVLTSESRGTKLPQVITNETGDFTFVNLAPDTYKVQVTMPGFKGATRGGVAVSPGDRVSVPPMQIEVGGTTENIEVKGTAPQLQAQSGERSYTIDTKSVMNLPIASRSFTELATLAPGVTVDGNRTPTREGGGGSTNIMMDGVSTMDTGSNRPLLQMNVESIAEVKVLVSGYQAEYGRASGVQVSAVTKSGSNRFHGAAYTVERHSKWNANSKTNILNGNAKGFLDQRDAGYSFGGPIGKPGGDNKLFFFYSQEFAPRTGGGEVRRYRMPTALERAGDFSQTLDNNGNLYNFIKDPNINGLCQAGAAATNQAACFADGGVLGKVPANRLYQTGLNILKIYPLPNLATVGGINYNYEISRPKEKLMSWQPAMRIDYQATQSLRATVRYSYWKQQNKIINGTLPGFNDTKMQNAPVASLSTSVNYTLNPTTFLEATYGRSANELAGCAQAQSGTGPEFCTNGIPVGAQSSLAANNLQSLPFLFPDATVLKPGYYAIQALNEIAPPYWDGTRMTKLPRFQWGGRVSGGPPGTNGNDGGNGFPGWLNTNVTQDFSVSMTKLMGRHTVKAGFYNTHSYKAEQTSNNAFGNINFQQDAVGTNPFDTSFGFANAAIGSFSSFQQNERYAETSAIYANREFYMQDNWRASSRLTFDYGLRFVNQVPQYDQLGQLSNFLPNKWSVAAAPTLYTVGCLNNAATCSGNTNRQAKNPLTGQLLGPNTTSAIGTLVPNSGNVLNGLYLPGQEGLSRATYDSPAIVYAPRFGAAYDVTGTQHFVIRGGGGLFYDRPSSTTFSAGVNNPPTAGGATVQFSQLQQLGAAGLTTRGAPGLSGIQLDSKVPTSAQWNTGVQMTLPYAMALDVAYVGQHSYSAFNGVDINSIDFGAAYLDKNRDVTAAPTVPGGTALPDVLVRPLKGYGGITMQLNRAWRTYHSIQWSLTRRFQNGLQFSFNDTMGLSDKANTNARIEHNADGTWQYRSDQAAANELLGNQNPRAHIMKATAVWDLPDIHSDNTVLRAVGIVANDWLLASVWNGATGGKYAVGFSYQSGAGNNILMGTNQSNGVGPRVYVVGDPGSGCSGDTIRQFNNQVGVFKGPAVNSVGLESSNGYLTGCFTSTLDLNITRQIRLGGGRTIQLRLDMFNAPNSAIITGRNTTMNLNNPGDPLTITNLPYDANGNLTLDANGVPNRNLPRNAGFGVVNGYQSPRTMQAQIRFQF
ncbi:MAG: carboxypeptidase regulatory-like domain-containing protein [Vicinamibacterales bacterium]